MHNITHSNTPNLNTSEQGSGDMKGIKSEDHEKGTGGSAALPEVLGGRSTKESMPVHEASMGYLEGGHRGITNIEEEGDLIDGGP